MMEQERKQADRDDRGVTVCYSAVWQPRPWAVMVDGVPVLHTASRTEAHRLAAQARRDQVEVLT